MALLQLVRISVGDVGVKPGNLKMISTDNLATVTAAGYLNGVGSIISPDLQIAPSDLIECLYSYSTWTDTGTLVFLQPSISNGVITLVVAANPLSEPLTNTHIFVGNASNVATDVAMSGDATMANTGALTIANSAITNAKVSASAAIAFSKLAALPSAQILVGSAGNVATAVAVTGDVTISNAGVTAIAAGAIVNADVNASAAIDFSKLATLTSGNILVGSAGNVATSVTMSGDATIIASGALTIANNAVTSAKVSPLLLKYATVAISAAEFKALYDTPKQIVAAQGANTLIVVHRAALVMTFVSAAYADGGVLSFQYDSTVHGAGVAASNTEAAADFFAAASTSFQFNGVAGNTVAIAPFTTSVNKGIYLSNLTGNFSTGDSTFTCQIWYSVIPTV